MRLLVHVQRASTARALPSNGEFESWVAAALEGRRAAAELTIRVVDEDEGAALNATWRRRRGPTNVLSFPLSGVDGIAPDFLGDIVICAPVVLQEAAEQRKPGKGHWAHMVVHGTLHLLGYDHGTEPEALAMERLEAEILDKLGYSDPYAPH